ncbi:MAG: hybrid sensor histidine kinase/response regulator [Candidatus Thermoplasmatota archaeon]
MLIGSRPEVLNRGKEYLEKEDESLEVVPASSSESALELFERKDFDIVLLDRDLPKMNIYNFFEKIRESNEMPRIILDGKEQSEMGIECLNINVDRHLLNNNDLKEKFTKLATIINQENNSVEERQEFLNSLLRHDLMNKIRLVRGDLQILKYEYNLPEEVEDRVVLLERRVKNSIDLIKKIKNHRKANEEIREMDLVKTLWDALKSMDDLLEDIKLDIRMDDQEHSKVKGGALLKEVFSNIIENAVKYSDGDEIRISTKESDTGVICSIEDNGDGIPDGEKEKIFQKGYTTDGNGSMGLGLFLVKKILEMYDGNIEVKDSELGGARFNVILKKI